MKKLLIAFVMILGLSFASCGEKSGVAATDCSCDSICACDSTCNCCAETIDTVSVDTLVVDTVAVDTIL